MATDNEQKTLDYGVFLADLERKRAALDQAIASVRAVMASGGLAINASDSMPGIAESVSTAIHGGEVPAGAFLGKSIPEAARLYLSIVKQKQTTREIAEALQRGGMETTSKKNNFEGIVAAGLNRVRKVTGDVLKVGRAWALPEWYPAGVRTAAKENRLVRKPKKARRQTQAKAALKTEAQPKANDRILEVLNRQPGMELSLQELSIHAGVATQVLGMILGKLIRKNHVQKTAAGKYRLAA